MAKTSSFRIKEHEKNIITIEEGKGHSSSYAIFFRKNGKLIFAISFLFSVTIFIIAIYFAMINVGDSSIVMYESNGVKVTFNGTNNSILNGMPITDDYATKLFDNQINIDSSSIGVVLKVKEVKLNDRIIIYYSDKTALIKYNNGGYSKISSVNGKYGIDENGIIDSTANMLDINGVIEENKNLGISILKLSDGSMEITKDGSVLYVRNSDVTSTSDLFYTNSSGVSLPLNKDNNKVYYSDGTIKDENGILVDGNRYGIIDKKELFDNIEIIYYQNGYAEIVKDDFRVMVQNSKHIVYTDSSMEIVENIVQGINIKDIMDIKEIELNNTNTVNSHYIIVLEETSNYDIHNVSRILDNSFINYNIYVNGNKYYNNVLDYNLKNSTKLEGVALNNNTYLLCEGTLEKLSSTTVKLGLWIDYEKITNEYMNSTFIGTVKVYIESIN